MKNLTNNSLKELNANELTGTMGGGFAFDAGRALRFIGIQLYYGYNSGLGTTMALTDFMMNMENNSI